MKWSWLYIDYLQRWGLLLLLGLAPGALAGFGYFMQEKQPLFTASAFVSFSGRHPVAAPPLKVVTDRKYTDPNEAVGSLLNNARLLRHFAGNAFDVDIYGFSLEGQYQSPLWKHMTMGSVIGGLLALGVAFVWDDAGSYLKQRRQLTFEDK